MRRERLDWREDGAAAIAAAAAEPGLVVVRFRDADAPPLPPDTAGRLATARAVTVAEVSGVLGGGALEAALLLDLVLLREDAALDPGDRGLPPAGALRAAVRAGRQALGRLLLDPTPVPAEEAVRLGLAAAVLPAGEALPLPDPASLPALTAARDLLRASTHPATRLRLEHAAFRLLFATGHPQEGARAFLERRDPRFP